MGLRFWDASNIPATGLEGRKGRQSVRSVSDEHESSSEARRLTTLLLLHVQAAQLHLTDKKQSRSDFPFSSRDHLRVSLW